jgi:N-acetylglucosaminyl-diphospho-decaprenol L-rhamnosyltransferase
MPRCSAIVVTYNSAGSIVACLEALAHEDCEIVVVDNGSQDQSVAQVQAFAKSHALQLLRISRNLGFGAGVNHGVRAASGEVLLILNPDAVAEPGAVGGLLQCIDSTGAAAVGGALLESDGQPQRGFAFRRLPTLSSLLCEVLLVNQLWPNNPVNRRYRCLDADYSRQQKVEQPAGACVAVTREAWESVGGFDPLFFPVWFDDVDLCKRLLDSGHKIVYCPGARFHHSGAHSVGQLLFEKRQLYWYANMLRYAGKHFSRLQQFVLRLGIVKGMALRWSANLFGKRPDGVTKEEAGPAYSNVALLALGYYKYRVEPPSDRRSDPR